MTLKNFVKEITKLGATLDGDLESTYVIYVNRKQVVLDIFEYDEENDEYAQIFFDGTDDNTEKETRRVFSDFASASRFIKRYLKN